MKNKEINLDLEALIKQMGDELRSGKPLTGTGGVFTPLIKKVIESSLEGEMDAHLKQEDKSSKNRRNGRGRKNVLSSSGGLEIFSPRDRNGTFEPQTIKKRQRRLDMDLSPIQPWNELPGYPGSIKGNVRC